jgi:hypothetical protein
MNGPTPRRLLSFVTRRLRLRRYLRDPGDGRPQPQIPAKLLLWALLVGQILRHYSFYALKRWCALPHAEIFLSRLLSPMMPWAISPNAWIPRRPAKRYSACSAVPSATKPSMTAAGSA